MHRVVEILQIGLVKAKRNVAERAENVPHVVKEDALMFSPISGKAQFDIIEEQRIAAERKSGGWRRGAAGHQRRTDIARAGLVERESAKGIRAAPEEALRQRNRLLARDASGRRKRSDHAELRLPRQNDRPWSDDRSHCAAARGRSCVAIQRSGRPSRSRRCCRCRGADRPDCRGDPARRLPTGFRSARAAAVAGPATPESYASHAHPPVRKPELPVVPWRTSATVGPMPLSPGSERAYV